MPLNETLARISIVAAAKAAVGRLRLDCADLALEVTARAVREQGRAFRITVRKPPKGTLPYDVAAAATQADFERELRRIRMNVGAVHLHDANLVTSPVARLEDVEPGDLILARTAPNPLYTGHTMIVVGHAAGFIETVEGHIPNRPPTEGKYTYEQLRNVRPGPRRWKWAEISPD